MSGLMHYHIALFLTVIAQPLSFHYWPHKRKCVQCNKIQPSLSSTNCCQNYNLGSGQSKGCWELLIANVISQTLQWSPVRQSTSGCIVSGTCYTKCKSSGTEKTLYRLRQEAYWVGMVKDVNHHCQECITCQQTKPHLSRKVPLMNMPVGRP